MLTRPRKNYTSIDELMTSSEMMAENRILALMDPMENHILGMMNDLRFLACEGKGPIVIEIICHGGPVAGALALYHVISSLNQSGVPVYTVGHTCYSAAALILAAGMPGHRYFYPKGTAMIHAASASVRGTVGQADMKILKKTDLILAELICELCGRPKSSRKKFYEDVVDNGTEFWFNAEEAKEFGFIDQIITPEIDRQLFGNLKVPSWEEAGPKKKKKNASK